MMACRMTYADDIDYRLRATRHYAKLKKAHGPACVYMHVGHVL